MPNHITNVLRINVYKHKGHDPKLVDEILEAVKGARMPFDFNRLIPMPSELDITSGGSGIYAKALNERSEAERMLEYTWVKSAGIADVDALRAHLRQKYLQRPEEGFPTLDDFAARIADNEFRFGHSDWYGWREARWGTKWNAYCCIAGKVDDQEAFVHFETAWAPPLPVLDELAIRYPAADLRLIWADEGSDRYHRVYWSEGRRERDEEEAEAA